MNEEKHEIKEMHLPWAIYWATFSLVFVLSNVAASTLPTWWFLALFGVLFLSPEAIGVLRKSTRGDTLSEFVVWFTGGKLFRKLWAVTFGLTLSSRAWVQWEVIEELWGDGVWTWQEKLPWDIFGIGLSLWLTGHFFYLLKKG